MARQGGVLVRVGSAVLAAYDSVNREANNRVISLAIVQYSQRLFARSATKVLNSSSTGIDQGF
jgi:hypothetical protein